MLFWVDIDLFAESFVSQPTKFGLRLIPITLKNTLFFGVNFSFGQRGVICISVGILVGKNGSF